MVPVRIPGLPHTARTRWHGLGLAIGCAVLTVGCGSASRVDNDPAPDHHSSVIADRSDRGQRMPAPDVGEIQFDTNSNMLKLYELPASARWMVQLPNDKSAVPVDREYKLPDGVDADRTYIYYAVPAGRQSKLVTLGDVQRSGERFTSRGH